MIIDEIVHNIETEYELSFQKDGTRYKAEVDYQKKKWTIDLHEGFLMSSGSPYIGVSVETYSEGSSYPCKCEEEIEGIFKRLEFKGMIKRKEQICLF